MFPFVLTSLFRSIPFSHVLNCTTAYCQILPCLYAHLHSNKHFCLLFFFYTAYIQISNSYLPQLCHSFLLLFISTWSLFCSLSAMSFVSSSALLPSCIPSVASGWDWSTFLFTSDYISLCVFQLPIKHLIFGPLCPTAGCSTVYATPSVSLHSCVDLPAEPLCSPPPSLFVLLICAALFFSAPPSHTHRIASSLSPHITPLFSFFLFFLAPYSLSTSSPSIYTDTVPPSGLQSSTVSHPLMPSPSSPPTTSFLCISVIIRINFLSALSAT